MLAKRSSSLQASARAPCRPARVLRSVRVNAGTDTMGMGTMGTVLEIADVAHFKTVLAETHAQNQILLVDYLTTWCGPCKLMAPEVEKLAAEYSTKGVQVAKFTCDASNANKKWAMDTNIRSLPTFRVYCHGKEEHAVQFTGTKVAELRKVIDTQIAAVNV